MKLKIGDKELKIKFGYKPTLKERLLSNIVKMSSMNEEENDMDNIEDFLLYLPEIILVGMQVYHEEYRYDYDTKAGKEDQLNKVFDLIDEYAESEDADLMKLFNDLHDEMMSNSFLASLFRKEQKKAAQQDTVQADAVQAEQPNGN